MFKNYIKIAWRNLWKNKGYSSLNIFGLAIGITCASLILLWVEDEVSFNQNFPKQDEVFYVPTNQLYEGEWRTFYQATPGPLAADLKQEIPEIIRAARTKGTDFLFTQGENSITRNGRYADTDILEIFSLNFIEGNKENALARPDGIVLTQKVAQDLFGEGVLVLNKVIQVDTNENYTVTGVIEDLPKNVTFGFDWLVPFSRFTDQEGMEWTQEYGSFFADTFVELTPGVDFAAVDAKVRKVIPEKLAEEGAEAFLHSIRDWHLRSKFENGKRVGGQITYVRLFALIALIILVIACINFMNLATARSEKRANEVGVRKVLGSGKKRLATQFMIEAIITAFISAVVSVLLLWFLIPQFNLLVGKELALQFSNGIHMAALFGITLICGLLAGWYPALYLSSFKPVEVLKGLQVKSRGATLVRKGLVVTQFAVSIVFIISTLIVYQQIQHVKGRELGYEKENLIEIPVNGDIIKKFDVIKEDMIATGKIENLGLNNSKILSGGNNTSGLSWQGGVDTEDILVSVRNITSSFFNTAGMQIVEGRGFNNNPMKDSTNLIVSESFASLMGTGSAIGKTIENDYTIIGVVKDYVYEDMYGTSDPVIFFNAPSDARFLYVKAKSDIAVNLVLPAIQSVLKTHNPAFPFEYQFVDDAFNAKFKSEQLTESLSKIFALLAIIISCLGLFGLSAYTAAQRRKEIGVRKVLGSSITGIVTLLSKDFLQLVLISLLIAGPLAWWMMKNWLQSYEYRIDMNWWVFAIAGLVAIAIAIVTVSFQAIKAAIANPVKSLRTE